MNVYYTSNPVQNTRMPSTWRSWVLRIFTFVAIAASNWKTCSDLYDLMYFNEYGSMLSALGNVKAMTAVVGLIMGVICYALYTVYARMIFVNLSRSLSFYCQKKLDIMQYRIVADCAMIALCAIKSLLSLIWLFNPTYATLCSSIVEPLVALAAMGAELLYFIRYAGKGNAWYAVSSMAVWLCMPVLFV